MTYHEQVPVFLHAASSSVTPDVYPRESFSVHTITERPFRAPKLTNRLFCGKQIHFVRIAAPRRRARALFETSTLTTYPIPI